MCGITLAECKHWGPRCPKTGRKVCANCCYRCEHLIRFFGTRQCGYKSPEKAKEERMKRAQARFDEENRKISEAFRQKRKEEARQWAIKQAKARARKARNPGGK